MRRRDGENPWRLVLLMARAQRAYTHLDLERARRERLATVLLLGLLLAPPVHG